MSGIMSLTLKYEDENQTFSYEGQCTVDGIEVVKKAAEQIERAFAALSAPEAFAAIENAVEPKENVAEPEEKPETETEEVQEE